MNVLPTSYTDAYPVLTTDYDPFNPYTFPMIGGALKLMFYDCDTNE